MQARGVGPFAVWALFNTITIPAFLLVTRRSPIGERIRSLRPVFVVMVLLQVFVVYVNLQALAEGFGGGVEFGSFAFVSPTLATGLAIAIGFAIVAAIHGYGFSGSYLSDQPQFMLQVAACAVVVLGALALGSSFTRVSTSATGDYLWAAWTGLGLLAAPYLAAQQHQRADHVTSDRAAVVMGLSFGGYLALVALVGSVLVSTVPLLSLPLVVAVVAVTTSTLDSAVAALQYLLDQRRALAVAALAVVSWPAMQSLGVVGLFTIYSSGRLVAVAAALAYLWWQSRDGRDEWDDWTPEVGE